MPVVRLRTESGEVEASLRSELDELRRQLEQALASLGPADARRKVVWRRQVELALLAVDLGLVQRPVMSRPMAANGSSTSLAG